MTCPHCERYKQSAAMWRNKAYELGGTPLPWKPDDLWVGLTADELNMIGDSMRTWNSHSLTDVYVAIEAALKEKNT